MKTREDQLEEIANGLAEVGYSIQDNFLTFEEVLQIREMTSLLRPMETFKRAGIGIHQERQIMEQVRGDFIKWIDPQNAPPALQRYTDSLKVLMTYLNQALFLSLKDFEVHLTIYPAGSFYKRHLDQFKTDDHRKLSAICYLNEDWKEEQGGQLRLYLPNGPLEVLPIAGRIVCFRSETIEHEVLPASRERLSITGWILDQYADLRHL